MPPNDTPKVHAAECRAAFKAFREAKDKLLLAQKNCPECERSRKKYAEARQALDRR